MTSKPILTSIIVALFISAPAGGVGIQSDEIEMSTISGDTEEPRRHFRLKNAEVLDASEASEIYEIVAAALATGYARSGIVAGIEYQNWTRFNTAPYPSATHGNHYLNNFANDIAHDYGKYETAGKLPVGSVLAKDSFAKTQTGGILLGPLFVMEKMKAGFNYVSGDWKYTLIGPDGRFWGETNGPGAKRVEYCISCHLAKEATDHLFFVPESVRIERTE